MPVKKKKSSNKPKSKPNRGKNKNKKKVEEVVHIDLADDEHFDDQLAIVYIEHCTGCYVYREQAQRFAQMLIERFPDQKFLMKINARESPTNAMEPRVGAFEIEIAKNARCAKERLWTGINVEPPRKYKFSDDYETVWPVVQSILHRMYIPD